VYADISAYGTSTSDALIIFKLSEAPRHALVISTYIETTDGVLVQSDELVTVPSNFTFTSSATTSRLRGIFYLSGSAALSGNYKIFLRASGLSSSQYVLPSSVTVSVLSSLDPNPAPEMVKAKFGDSGSAAWIEFDVATDFAGISSSTWACSKLFSFTSVEYSTCKWINTTFVRITFSTTTSASLLVPGLLRT
jgi:hypothetical protein